MQKKKKSSSYFVTNIHSNEPNMGMKCMGLCWEKKIKIRNLHDTEKSLHLYSALFVRPCKLSEQLLDGSRSRAWKELVFKNVWVLHVMHKTTFRDILETVPKSWKTRKKMKSLFLLSQRWRINKDFMVWEETHNCSRF